MIYNNSENHIYSNGYNSTYPAYISTVSHHISIHVTTEEKVEEEPDREIVLRTSRIEGRH